MVQEPGVPGLFWGSPKYRNSYGLGGPVPQSIGIHNGQGRPPGHMGVGHKIKSILNIYIYIYIYICSIKFGLRGAELSERNFKESKVKQARKLTLKYQLGD